MIDFEDYDHQLVAIGKRLEKNPDDWEAWAAKADILYSLGMNEIAIRCCDKTLALNPDNVLTWVTKGNALIKLGKNEEANLPSLWQRIAMKGTFCKFDWYHNLDMAF